MGLAAGMKPEEVCIVRHQNATLGGGKSDLCDILGAGQTGLDRSCDTNTTATQASRYNSNA